MTSFSDDFNRADSTALGAGWVEVSGNWSIVSDQLSPGTDSGTVILRASGAMDSSDHYAEIVIATPRVASMGVCCRGNAGFTTAYLLRHDGGTNLSLFSVVDNTFDVRGAHVTAIAPGDVLRIQAVGSTIKGFLNGSEVISVVNSSVPSGTGVGLRSGTPSTGGEIRYDSFSAADVAAGATLGTASEVDTAQALVGAKAATLGASLGTDTAQQLVGAKSASLTAALSVETAVPLVGSKATVLGTASETDTARPLARQSTAVPSPDRTYRIPPEMRRLAVAAEQRTLEVGRG
ncbi:hypothetical protein [Streptomyces sp. NPDC050504]|uniref:hypothetical protein n=1 Tax=Streptomyces sp. NPDC050504 TaxID=3365618 RepID=UPI0037948AD4